MSWKSSIHSKNLAFSFEFLIGSKFSELLQFLFLMKSFFSLKKIEFQIHQSKMTREVEITKDRGVLKYIIKEGEGIDLNQKDSIFTVHYTGKLQDGTIFETTNNQAPLDFEIGKDQVIKGIELCVTTMKIGEISKVIIQPEYGHGKFEILFFLIS
jgi:FKBP-type peptidyl-prolyl cis-trans isomerase